MGEQSRNEGKGRVGGREKGGRREGRDRDKEDHHDLFNIWNERKFRHGGQQFNHITPVSKNQRNQ